MDSADKRDVLEQAADAAAAAEEAYTRAQIRTCFVRAPKVAEVASNRIQGASVRLAPRRLVTRAMLVEAIDEIPQARCKWKWAWTGFAGFVIAMLEFPTARALNLAFRWPRYHKALGHVCDTGRLWVTSAPSIEIAADSFGLVGGQRLPVNVDDLVKVLNSTVGYAWRP